MAASLCGLRAGSDDRVPETDDPAAVSGLHGEMVRPDERADALRQVLAKRFGYGLAPQSITALEA